MENEELVAQYQKTRSDDLFNELLRQNLSLVGDLARRFANGYDEEDFRQEALIALNKAALGYRNTNKCKFSSFATTVIRNQLINYYNMLRPKGVCFTTLDAASSEMAKNTDPTIMMDLSYALSKIPTYQSQAVVSHYFSGKNLSKSVLTQSKMGRNGMRAFL